MTSVEDTFQRGVQTNTVQERCWKHVYPEGEPLVVCYENNKTPREGSQNTFGKHHFGPLPFRYSGSDHSILAIALLLSFATDHPRTGVPNREKPPSKLAKECSPSVPATLE
jgi:hypothetical protein